jgi:hypothetical protein
MKKIIARIILSIIALALVGSFIKLLVVNPCIEAYAEYGLIGVVAVLVALLIVVIVAYVTIWLIIGWCLKNI